MKLAVVDLDELDAMIRKAVKDAINGAEFGTTAQVLTIYEAADYLKTSDRTLRRMVHEQSSPAFRVRNRIFLRQSDLDRWIRGQMGEGQAR
jgi:excisionase family DNA binding protein